MAEEDEEDEEEETQLFTMCSGSWLSARAWRMEEQQEQEAQLFRMCWGTWLSALAWGVEETEEPDVDDTTVSASSQSTSSDSASPEESSSSEGSESDWSAGWAGGVLVVAALHLAVDSHDECSLSGDAQVTGLNKSGAPVGVSGAIAVFLAGGGDNR